MGEFNVNKTTGGLDPTAGMPETYPAEQVLMSDGVTSVEDAVDEVTEALTIGNVSVVPGTTLNSWVVTNVGIASNALYSIMYISIAGMRYQLILLGANLGTATSPIGMTGNINETNNILLSKDTGSNNLAVYISSGVGTGELYIAKLIDILGIV